MSKLIFGIDFTIVAIDEIFLHNFFNKIKIKGGCVGFVNGCNQIIVDSFHSHCMPCRNVEVVVCSSYDFSF
jgi:hypothetical protein